MSRAERDPAAVREELIGLKEPERRKRAKAAQETFDRVLRDRPSRRWQAAAIEWAGTATARKLSSDFWRIGFEPESYAEIADDLYAVLAARGRAFFETFARLAVREEFGATWPLVRRAVREGLIEPPTDDDYVRRLVSSLGAHGGMRRLDGTYAELVADPELLDREVWQLFEVDVAAELSNATTWEAPTASGQTGTRGDNRWLYALTRLADEGRLERPRLLDASLDALLRDFRASSVGWYAKLHESLAPTPEERVERLDRYLSLVASPTPAVAREGLAALRAIEEQVPPDAFARVAPTPFSQRQKNLSTETLSLLAALCKRYPEQQPVLLDAVTHALGHERTDVQERALKLLEQHPDAVPRAELLGYVDVVSPTLRARVEALTGVEAPRREPPTLEAEAPVHRPADVVSAEPAPLERVETVDELIELAAMLVEGGGDGDDCERFLDGVSRLCDERPPAFGRRTAGLVKRAQSVSYWGPAVSGAELVAYVVHSWVGRRRPGPIEPAETVMGVLVDRAKEVAHRAARRRPRALLAFPTHRGGTIDPEALVERLSRVGRLLNRPDQLDRLQAEARAYVPGAPLEYDRQATEATRWGTTVRRLRLVASGGPAELGILGRLAERAGSIHDTGKGWYDNSTAWAGFDRLGNLWAQTVLPTFPEVGFAGSAMVAVAASEGSDSSGHPEVPLELALSTPRPLPRVAWLSTAACLVVKSPGPTRVAVDLLVATVEDGRFSATALGEDIAWLVDRDFAKVNRLEAPLKEVARVSPLHGVAVLRTVECVLADLGTRPHGLHGLLDVAVESAAATGGRVEDERARATLSAIAADSSRSSKLGRLARSLVEA